VLLAERQCRQLHKISAVAIDVGFAGLLAQ
jgi:hypothetical protein